METTVEASKIVSKAQEYRTLDAKDKQARKELESVFNLAPRQYIEQAVIPERRNSVIKEAGERTGRHVPITGPSKTTGAGAFVPLFVFTCCTVWTRLSRYFDVLLALDASEIIFAGAFAQYSTLFTEFPNTGFIGSISIACTCFVNI